MLLTNGFKTCFVTESWHVYFFYQHLKNINWKQPETKHFKSLIGHTQALILMFVHVLQLQYCEYDTEDHIEVDKIRIGVENNTTISVALECK